jgi:hypothetical protein
MLVGGCPGAGSRGGGGGDDDTGDDDADVEEGFLWTNDGDGLLAEARWPRQSGGDCSSVSEDGFGMDDDDYTWVYFYRGAQEPWDGLYYLVTSDGCDQSDWDHQRCWQGEDALGGYTFVPVDGETLRIDAWGEDRVMGVFSVDEEDFVLDVQNCGAVAGLER